LGTDLPLATFSLEILPMKPGVAEVAAHSKLIGFGTLERSDQSRKFGG
jgi:hypothetical protein